MYGYVRPVKGELKVSEYERFRGVYCGLCHELKRRYGFLCRFLVNYDFTFLAMILAGDGEQGTCAKRCVSHPFRKTQCLAGCDSLAAAADRTVILGWWKLMDGADDKTFPASWGYKLACFLLRRAYRKAAKSRPAFSRAVADNLRQLQQLERQNCPSLDETADKFAAILRSIAAEERDGTRQRVLGEFLYHLGRIIYILDAVDDLAEDVKSDSYNPLRYRFHPEGGKLAAADEAELRISMQHSHNAISAALSLLPENVYSGIISNTVYLGLPAVTQAVFSGTWKASPKLKRGRSSI